MFLITVLKAVGWIKAAIDAIHLGLSFAWAPSPGSLAEEIVSILVATLTFLSYAAAFAAMLGTWDAKVFSFVAAALLSLASGITRIANFVGVAPKA